MPDGVDPLERFWAIFDFEGAVVSAQDTVWWNPGELDALIGCGLLTPTTNAAQVSCTACDERHIEAVELERGPDGTSRCVIPCPEGGRIEVDLAMLRQWSPDFQALARALKERLNINGRATARVDNRLWRLGKTSWRHQSREAYLARGLTWPDGASIVRQIPCEDRPIVFVGLCAPHPSVWPAVSPAVVPMAAVLGIEEGRLELDHTLLVQWVAGADRTAEAQFAIADGNLRRRINRYAEQRLAQGDTTDLVNAFGSQGLSTRETEVEMRKRGVPKDHATIARKRQSLDGKQLPPATSSASVLRSPSSQPRNSRGKRIRDAQAKPEE